MDRETQNHLALHTEQLQQLRERIDRTYTQLYTQISVGGSGGGAPTDTPYVVIVNDGRLSAERAIAEGWGIELTDGGAGGSLTVTVDQTDLDGRYLQNPMPADLDMNGHAIVDVGNVDGVDISSFYSSYSTHITLPDAHHDPVTAGDGIDLSGQQVAVDVTDLIDTNYGLIENSNDIRVNLGTPSGLTFSSGALVIDDGIAGAGLTIASKILAVVVGDGLDVDGDSIIIDVTDFIDTDYGLTEYDNDIRVNLAASGGLAFDSGAIIIGTPSSISISSTNSVATATHAHAIITSNNPGATAAVLSSSASGYLTLVRLNTDTLADRSGGDLTISPAGDIILNPTGAQIRVAASHTLQSNNYASQTTGWGITYAGGGDFRYLFADELHAKIFVTDLEQALAGGQIISKSVAMLSRAFTAPAAGATATLYVWDLPSAEDMAVFESGDIVRLRTFSRAGGSLTIADCWGVVTSYSNLSDREQSWTFTRSSAPNAGTMAATTVVAADSLALDYGTTGNGFHEINAIDGVYAANSPYSQIVTWDTHPATGQTVRTRLGNLFGITAETEYGLYAGEGVTAGDSYLRLSDQYFELHNIDFAMYDDGNVQRIGMDAGAGSTDKLMWAGPSASDPRFVVYGDGTTWLSTLAISADMGQAFFNQADGLLLLSPYQAITPTSWAGTRGETATISGAFHQVPGYWPSTRALVIEVGATNLCPNPSFETDTTSWAAYGTGSSAARITTDAFIGNACYQVTTVTAGAYGCRLASQTVVAEAAYTATASIKGQKGETIRFVLQGRDASDVAVAQTNFDFVATGEWQRVKVTRTMGATEVKARILVWTYSYAGVVLVDAVQLEAGAYATSYLDGSLGTGYAWSGAAHASTSTRTATEVNLDALAGVVSESATLTFSVWVQMPYAADVVWPRGGGNNNILDMYDATSGDRILFTYNDASDQFIVKAGGVDILTSAVQTFSAGDWLHLALTLDFTNDAYALYINGVVDVSDTTSLAAQIATQFNMGSSYAGTYQAGIAYADFAVFGRAFTAQEVSALYIITAQRPLADFGAFDTPGIYVLDGKFDLRSATTGARVQIDATGVAAYSAATTKTISIETDGDMFAGSDVSAAATTAFAVFAAAQTYNSESVGAGDVLLGDNSANKANVLWDKSAGWLLFRSGSTTHAYIDTSGKIVFGNGDGWLDTDGLTFDVATSVSSNAEAVKWKSGSDEIGRAVSYTSIGQNYLAIWVEDPDENTLVHASLLSGTAAQRAEIYVESSLTGTDYAKAGMQLKLTGSTFYIRDSGSAATQIAIFDDLNVLVERGVRIGALSGNAPYGYAYLTGGVSIDEVGSTPTHALTSSAQADIYLKGDKLIFRFNDGGTVRYKYLDLSGTGVTWVHTTTAP